MSTLRYFLNHRPEFDTRDGEHGQVVCGFEEVVGFRRTHRSASQRSAYRSEQVCLLKLLACEGGTRKAPTAALVEALLCWLGGPIHLDDLEGLMAHTWASMTGV